MNDLPEKYFVTGQEVFKMRCQKVPACLRSGDTFVVTKYDIYSDIEKDIVMVSISAVMLACHLNCLGGSPEMNKRLEPRPMTKHEEFLYAMRAVEILPRTTEEGTELIQIHPNNFKDLLSSETNIDLIDETFKKLVYRFFKNLPMARLSTDDIFISTISYLGDIQLRLLEFSKDGYIKEVSDNLYEKDREGFRRLGQEIQAKSSLPTKTKQVEEEDFSFVVDTELREIIERDYQEVQKVKNAKAPKATIVLAGSIIEALLLEALLKDSPKAKIAPKAPKENELRKWHLNSLIEVAEELGKIEQDTTQFSYVVKDYRNLIHPGKEIRIKLKPKPEEAEIAFQVLKKVIRDLKAGY
ncbi:MAG: hypothetical protein WCE90_03015 [Candidatus Zixiibacteriota bacterium]